MSIFFIKTKRNYEIVLEYGKFEQEQNEMINDNSQNKAFYLGYENRNNNQPIYFNTKNGDYIRIIEMNKDNYIKSTLTNFYLKINFVAFRRLYDLLDSIGKTPPEKGDYYDSYSFAAQFLKLINGELDYKKKFNRTDLYFLPLSILNQLKEN